jgi:hypothetical protein
MEFLGDLGMCIAVTCVQLPPLHLPLRVVRRNDNQCAYCCCVRTNRQRNEGGWGKKEKRSRRMKQRVCRLRISPEKRRGQVEGGVVPSERARSRGSHCPRIGADGSAAAAGLSWASAEERSVRPSRCPLFAREKRNQLRLHDG